MVNPLILLVKGAEGGACSSQVSLERPFELLKAKALHLPLSARAIGLHFAWPMLKGFNKAAICDGVIGLPPLNSGHRLSSIFPRSTAMAALDIVTIVASPACCLVEYRLEIGKQNDGVSLIVICSRKLKRCFASSAPQPQASQWQATGPNCRPRGRSALPGL